MITWFLSAISRTGSGTAASFDLDSDVPKLFFLLQPEGDDDIY